MNVTVVTPTGEKVVAPAERWLCGLIALLPDDDKARLLRLVASRLEIGHIAGHIISVPSIDIGERFGRLGGEG